MLNRAQALEKGENIRKGGEELARLRRGSFDSSRGEKSRRGNLGLLSYRKEKIFKLLRALSASFDLSQ
jgi:hypothetical protein